MGGALRFVLVAATVVACSAFGGGTTSDPPAPVGDAGPTKDVVTATAADADADATDGGTRYCDLPESKTWTTCLDFEGTDPPETGWGTARTNGGGTVVTENGTMIANIPATADGAPHAYLTMEADAASVIELDFDVQLEAVGTVDTRPGMVAAFRQGKLRYELYVRQDNARIQVFEQTGPTMGMHLKHQDISPPLRLNTPYRVHLRIDPTQFSVAVNTGSEDAVTASVPIGLVESSKFDEINLGITYTNNSREAWRFRYDNVLFRRTP